jgi:hypothetical protein
MFWTVYKLDTPAVAVFKLDVKEPYAAKVCDCIFDSVVLAITMLLDVIPTFVEAAIPFNVLGYVNSVLVNNPDCVLICAVNCVLNVDNCRPISTRFVDNCVLKLLYRSNVEMYRLLNKRLLETKVEPNILDWLLRSVDPWPANVLKLMNPSELNDDSAHPPGVDIYPIMLDSSWAVVDNIMDDVRDTVEM